MNIITYVREKKKTKGKSMKEEKCASACAVHADTVKRILEGQPNEETLYDLAELFKVFGDSTRIRILYALFESELCVGDISYLLGISQSAISHQLKILKDAGLVRFRRVGKNMIYMLADDHVRCIIGMGMEHVAE